MSIKQILSSTALIATDYPELFDDDNTTNSNNSNKITLFSKNILPTTSTDINYKDLYNNITTVDDSRILDEIENENFNGKSEEYNQEEKEKQHNIISGYYNFHINANLVNGLVGGGGSVSGSSSISNSNNRYNNVMNAGIFQNNGGLFFHQGQYNSMRSSLGTSNSSLHGNVNILLGGAMLSVVITVLCVVCYCCHRNIKKRTESAYRQRWLENDPNMEIYSVEQCYETSGLFMDSDETLANQVPPLSHQPPPSYDAVVAMDEMINHRTSPPPGYRSTTSITSNNNAIKYIDFQQQPSTSSSTAASVHHQHHRHHNHDLQQQHNNRLTSQLQLPNHYRHRPSFGKCPSLRNYNHHRSFGNRQPGTYEKNYHFRMLRTESCCSLERALGGCRISALDSSSSSNGSILEDENISLPPNIHSRLAVNNSSTSSKLNTPSIPSTSVGSDYDHNCPLCGKFRNYSNCSNLNENLNKFNMKLAHELDDKNLPETTAKLTSCTSRINHLDYTGREQELNCNTLKINNSPIASGSSARTSSSSSSSHNLSHTCDCNSINSQQLPLSENSTNLTSLTIPSTSITDETNTSYLTEFFEADQMMDTNQDEINKDAPLVKLLIEDNNDNNNTNNNSNNNINDIINNNNGSNNMNNITNNNNNNLIKIINDCVNNNNNFNEDYQSSAESLQQQINKKNCNNNASNISNDNSNNNINETVINQNTGQTTVCQNIMATSSVNGFNNNNNNNNNNNVATCSNSIDSIDSINDNGIIRLDMSQMIDRTGLPTYDAAIKLQSSGYV